MKNISALELANYLLNYQSEHNLNITHLKLQKLLYYIQAYHLAILNKPIFNEDIEAWEYGPVIPVVYHEYKQFEYNIIDIPQDKYNIKDVNSIKVITSVLACYGEKSPMELMSSTHMEEPWSSVYKVGKNNIITHQSMKKYYKQFVND